MKYLFPPSHPDVFSRGFMPSVREHIAIDVPADIAWKIVGNPDSVASWAPGIHTSATTNGVRTLTLKRGGLVVESIVTNDDRLRRFQYRVIKGLPLQSHLGTLDVIELCDQRCLVIYSSDVMPPDALAGIHSSMQISLARLERLALDMARAASNAGN